MSQCLQNLLDKHQKTGMAATHASLTKRKKSPAPDVQLIQPPRQKHSNQQNQKPKRTQKKKPSHYAPIEKEGLLNRYSFSVWLDKVAGANPQDSNNTNRNVATTSGSFHSDYWLQQVPNATLSKYFMEIPFNSRLCILLACSNSTATRNQIGWIAA